MDVFALGELHHLPGLVVGADERTEQPERDRSVGDQLQILAIDLDGGTLFRPAGNQADGGFIAGRNVVGAGQAASHQHAGAGGSHVGVIGGAARHGQIEVAVLEDLGSPAVPVFEYIGHAHPADFGNEEAAVKEGMALGNLSGTFEEHAQVAAHRWVGDIGEAKFAEQAALLFLGRFAAW